ncbi:hypothetical protein ACFW04_003153 [Cataglyphis niger]
MIMECKNDKGQNQKLERAGTGNDRNSRLDQPLKEHILTVQPLIWCNITGIALLHVMPISHRSWKVKLPLRICSFIYSITSQLCCRFILPAVISVYLWNEIRILNISDAFLRGMYFLSTVSSIYRKIDRIKDKDLSGFANLKARENRAVSIVSFDEGWHNYHHVFPWDYKAAELDLHRFNLTTAFIDFMACLGLAYDLKTPSSEMINSFCAKKGDSLSKPNAKYRYNY